MYNVFQKTIVEDGAPAIAVTEKADLLEAKMLYHQILASAYANAQITFVLVEIINDFGNIEVMERYEKPAPAPEEVEGE